MRSVRLSFLVAQVQAVGPIVRDYVGVGFVETQAVGSAAQAVPPDAQPEVAELAAIAATEHKLADKAKLLEAKVNWVANKSFEISKF